MSGNVHRISPDSVPYGAPKRQYRIYLATDVISAGITLERVNIVFVTGFENTNVHMPIANTSMVVLGPISVSNKEQEDGRTGRTIAGISKCLTTKETFKLLEYNPGPLTREELTLYLLNKSRVSPRQIIQGFYATPEPINFNNLMIALKNVSAWGLISLTNGEIKALGEAVLSLAEAKITLHQALIILLCLPNKLPISIGIMFAIMLEKEKFVPVFKRPESKLDSLEELFNRTMTYFTDKKPKYDPSLFEPYMDIKNHLAKNNNRSDYKVEELFTKKITEAKMRGYYSALKKIIKIVYYDGFAEYNKNLESYVTNNGNLIKTSNVYEKHINKKYKLGALPKSIYVISYVNYHLGAFSFQQSRYKFHPLLLQCETLL